MLKQIFQIMSKEQHLSDFVEKFMVMSSAFTPYSEGCKIINRFCENKCGRKKSLNVVYCKTLILEIIPEIVASKHGCNVTDEKLEMFWGLLDAVSRASAVSYEQFLRCCRKKMLKQSTENKIRSSRMSPITTTLL